MRLFTEREVKFFERMGGDMSQLDKVSRLDEIEKSPCLTKQQLGERSRIRNELRYLVFSRSKGLVRGGMNSAGAGGGEAENEARPSGENPICFIFSPKSNNSSLPMSRP